MNFDTKEIVARIKKASEGKSVREAAVICGISYERVRQIRLVDDVPEMGIRTYKQIDEALKQHGF